MASLDNLYTTRAARGTVLSATSWLTEAPLRMLMNNLEPDVADQPATLSSTAASAGRHAIATASTASAMR